MIARILGVIGRAMIAAGVLLLLFAAYQLWGTGLRTDRAQTNLKSQLDEQLSRVANDQPPIARSEQATQAIQAQAANNQVADAPDDTADAAGVAAAGGDDPSAGLGGSSTTGTRQPGTTTPGGKAAGDPSDPNVAQTTAFRFAKGDAIGQITIPKIGADFTIVEGVDLPLLSEGPGHFPGTALPGQAGNAALAGHRVTYKAPFNRIDELSPGDDITIKTVQGTFTYQVMPQAGGLGYFITDPSNVSIVDDKGDNRLTLVACHPKYDLKQRIVVTAKLVGNPADGSVKSAADHPILPNPDGSDFQGTGDLLPNDPGAKGPAIVLSLLALAIWLLAWLVAKRFRGWAHWVVYLVASPFFFVVLWFAFDYINRSLPGVY
jgi:sortase A